eukprot:4526448-Prymnesium_polylepis.1
MAAVREAPTTHTQKVVCERSALCHGGAVADLCPARRSCVDDIIVEWQSGRHPLVVRYNRRNEKCNDLSLSALARVSRSLEWSRAL